MIRFTCQRCGHRLVIKKTAWAGQMATCPQCKGQTPIPTSRGDPRSTGSSRPEEPVRGEHHPEATQIQAPDATRVEHTPPPSMHSDEGSFELAGGAHKQPPATPGKPAGRPGEAFTLDKPQPLGWEGGADPIAQKPRKIWYVRIPEQGEKGPLKGNRLREMLDAHEIPPDAAVWREDWDDWLAASDVFPELSPSNAPSPSAPRRRPRRRPGWLVHLPTILAVAIGLAIIVFLTIILFVLINR